MIKNYDRISYINSIMLMCISFLYYYFMFINSMRYNIYLSYAILESSARSEAKQEVLNRSEHVLINMFREWKLDIIIEIGKREQEDKKDDIWFLSLWPKIKKPNWKRSNVPENEWKWDHHGCWSWRYYWMICICLYLIHRPIVAIQEQPYNINSYKVINKLNEMAIDIFMVYWMYVNENTLSLNLKERVNKK